MPSYGPLQMLEVKICLPVDVNFYSRLAPCCKTSIEKSPQMALDTTVAAVFVVVVVVDDDDSCDNLFVVDVRTCTFYAKMSLN